MGIAARTYNIHGVDSQPFTQQVNMSPIIPQQQESLNKDFAKLDGKEQAELLLASILGKQLRSEGLEMIGNAIVRYANWHEKQHPNFQTCEHCEFIQKNVVMYSVMKHWVEIFEATVNKK